MDDGFDARIEKKKMLGTIFLMLTLFIFNAENLKLIEQNRRVCTLDSCKGELCWKVENLFRRKTNKKNTKKNMKDNDDFNSTDYNETDYPIDYDTDSDEDENADEDINLIDDKDETWQDSGFTTDSDINPENMDDFSQRSAPRCKISRKFTLLSYYGTIFGEENHCES